MHVATQTSVQLPELPAEPGTWPSASEIAHVFSAVPLLAPTDEVAAACVEAVRRVAGCPCSLAVPTRPVPLNVGDDRAGMSPRVRFPAPGGQGELWTPDDTEVPDEVRAALAEQLARVWGVQELRAGQ